jgi:hypothetical protein
MCDSTKDNNMCDSTEDNNMCDICLVVYDAKYKSFANSCEFGCQCSQYGSNKICTPCMTLILLKKCTFLAKRGDGVILELDEEYEPKCPFCRSKMPESNVQLYGFGSFMYTCILAIKFHLYLGEESQADIYRKKYLDIFGFVSPI